MIRHGNPLLFKKLNKTQIRSKRIDELKENWAALNGIPVIRIWECDIHDNPQKVIELLENRIELTKKKKIIKS